MSNLGDFLRKQRGKESLRDFAKRCGISHTHLDSIEKGVDPRTQKPVRITTDTLRNIANGLQVNYMLLAALAEDESTGDTVFFTPAENKIIGNRLKAALLGDRTPLRHHLIQDGTIDEMLAGTYLFTANTLSQIASYVDKPLEYFLQGTGADPDIDFDDFTYAMAGESKELAPEDKKALLDMARLLKEKNAKKKE